MKVYVATSGEYSDFRIHHIFANREDAEDYAGADEVTEWDVMEHPIEQRPWHTLIWSPHLPDRDGDSLRLSNPHQWTVDKDYTGQFGYVTHYWASRTNELALYVEGWELDRVLKVYSEQRAMYLAQQEV